ncbi:urease [Photobacterium sanctipauli]|uniref:Urease n=1 Tax=Photobacterium sanctipauli TaxID=1342794 RepID=A0A2T3NNG6_9GAMM|nr:RNA-binding S4 domain-containing protein [Photobacterium sanctipauli]PSW17206.1 urease [Photobacterium sanctipauli]
MSEENNEYEVEALGVEVSAQPIELYKVLKIANAVSGGGEAKFAISEGYVAVNGELEQRKRRKIYDGDVIEFNNEFYLVICDQPVSEQPDPKAEKPKPAQPKPSKQQRGKSAQSNKGNKAKAGKKSSKPAKQKSGPADKNTGRKLLNF